MPTERASSQVDRFGHRGDPPLLQEVWSLHTQKLQEFAENLRKGFWTELKEILARFRPASKASINILGKVSTIAVPSKGTNQDSFCRNVRRLSSRSKPRIRSKQSLGEKQFFLNIKSRTISRMKLCIRKSRQQGRCRPMIIGSDILVEPFGTFTASWNRGGLEASAAETMASNEWFTDGLTVESGAGVGDFMLLGWILWVLACLMLYPVLWRQVCRCTGKLETLLPLQASGAAESHCSK